jgi:HSP20 family protein
MDDLRREMERAFGSLSQQGWDRWAGVFPAINVSDKTDAVVVRAELPGIEPAELDVSVHGNTLSIAGERRPQSEREEVNYHRREREWGTFRRSFTLPSRVDAAAVKARYVDGILTVELPKAAEARPKQIAVQTGV